jgi:hypothetical protein
MHLRLNDFKGADPSVPAWTLSRICVDPLVSLTVIDPNANLLLHLLAIFRGDLPGEYNNYDLNGTCSGWGGQDHLDA